MGTPMQEPVHVMDGGIVGRRREIDALRGWLGAARDGAGRLVLCAGEPGIGKTRLAQELAGIALAGRRARRSRGALCRHCQRHAPGRHLVGVKGACRRFFAEKLGPALAKVLGPEPAGAPEVIGIDVVRSYVREPVA